MTARDQAALQHFDQGTIGQGEGRNRQPPSRGQQIARDGQHKPGGRVLKPVARACVGEILRRQQAQNQQDDRGQDVEAQAKRARKARGQHRPLLARPGAPL